MLRRSFSVLLPPWPALATRAVLTVTPSGEDATVAELTPADSEVHGLYAPSGSQVTLSLQYYDAADEAYLDPVTAKVTMSILRTPVACSSPSAAPVSASRQSVCPPRRQPATSSPNPAKAKAKLHVALGDEDVETFYLLTESGDILATPAGELLLVE